MFKFLALKPAQKKRLHAMVFLCGVFLSCVGGESMATGKIRFLPSIIPPITFTEANYDELIDLSHLLPQNEQYVNWVFSGVASNEKGDQFGYYFQMQRTGDVLHTTAALLDADTNAVILQEENESSYNAKVPYHWQVGRSFLTFNPITASWVIGVKTIDKKGFNFKIDMLTAKEQQPIQESMRPGMSVVINQTSVLNGHVRQQAGSEEFVTAKHAWFRQIVMTDVDAMAHHSVSGLLCHFDDNSGLYAMKLPESDAIQGAMAGRIDATGKPQMMSQFIQMKQSSEGAWDIHVPSPNYHLVLSQYAKQHAMIAGFVMHDKTKGFCLLSDEQIG